MLFKAYRKRINSPYKVKSLITIGATLFILLVIPLTVILVNQSREPSSKAVSEFPTSRDPLKWPFASDSIWNLPIGVNAEYVDAQITEASNGPIMDTDIIILAPGAPMTEVYYSSDKWKRIFGRCDSDVPLNLLHTLPIPANFIVPGSTPDSRPNNAAAILMSDERTLKQMNCFTRCTASQPATANNWSVEEDIYGGGITGAHGGSMLSSIGGTIRLGELVPNGTIRHTLKLNITASENVYYDSATGGYRWPALKADSYASTGYGGTNLELRMGALLALKPDFDKSQLNTEPARILAQALQDYGAYVVDTFPTWSSYGFMVEVSPDGNVMSEFNTVWGFSMQSGKGTAWANEMDRIFGALYVVDNWNESLYNTVAASNGVQGAGGGTPIQPWAPNFGPPSDDTEDPTVSISSPADDVTVSGTVNIQATATDNVGVTKVEFYVAGDLKSTDTSSPYSYSWDTTTVSNDTHSLLAKAYDGAGNEGNSTAVTVTVDNTSSPKPGDINGDGVVNIFDASILASRWGTNDPDADLNGNGVVDIFDASIMASNWDG